MIDRKLFFSRIRKSLFSGRIGPRQIEGINTILNQWFEGGSSDMRPLAYILATAYHETAWTFQPIKERGGTAYLTNNYDISGSRPKLARANGNIRIGDGARYAGRGFVQLTWRNNYRSVGKRLDIDLEGNPHLAMQIDTAASILIKGMQEGWLTGRKLPQYFNASTEDWVNARRTVNGVDKARSIAAQAKLFLVAMVVIDTPQILPATTEPSKAVPPLIPAKPATQKKLPQPTKAKAIPTLTPDAFQMPPIDGRRTW
jgi:putative chitinase